MEKKTKEMEKGSLQNGLLFTLSDESSIIKRFRCHPGSQGRATPQQGLCAGECRLLHKADLEELKPSGYQTQTPNMGCKYTAFSYLGCSFD